MASGRIISRDEAALMLDVSVHELRRRQKANQLKVVKRGTRGQVFYDFDTIETLRVKRTEMSDPSTLAENTPAMAAYSTDDAVKVFGELEKGATVIECVRRLSIHPSKVEAIAYTYEHLAGAIILQPSTVQAINELPLDGTFPVTKASDVLSLLTASAQGTPCTICAKSPRHLCKGCAIPFVRRQLAREARAEKKATAAPDGAAAVDD